MDSINKNEIYYQASVCVLNKLLQQAFISEEEYKKIDALNIEKWKPLIASI